MFIIDFLKTVIEFIDKYDGAMIVFLTFVLAGITFFYLLETRKIREINQEMLKVSNTPDIQVSLSSDYWISDISSINLSDISQKHSEISIYLWSLNTRL